MLHNDDESMVVVSGAKFPMSGIFLNQSDCQIWFHCGPVHSRLIQPGTNHDIMHLSILCPTTLPTGLGGGGFVVLASTKAPPLGATLADKSPFPVLGVG